MSATWELVKSGQGAERRTVYHSCKAHQPSGLRLAVAHREGRWEWSVYDMTQGSVSGGLLIQRGTSTTWPNARKRAESKALSIWKRDQNAQRRLHNARRRLEAAT